MSRKKEFQKVFNRIDATAKEGKDYIYEYMKVIDDIVEEGLYFTLSDVMMVKYGIKLEDYRTLDDFKMKSYRKIRQITNSYTLVDFKNLFKYRSVYNIGNKYYDSNNNLFLGVINEFDSNEKRDWSRHPELSDSKKINLEYYWGLTPSYIPTIGTFSDDSITKKWSFGDLANYQTNVWECFSPYTYSSTNRITPTFSSNWIKLNNATFSYNTSTSSSSTLYDKWNQAIDGVKSYLYTNPNLTNTGTFSPI